MSKIEKVQLISGLPQSDMAETDETKPSYVKNKPTSLPADGGNSNTVNGHTVEADVPADAKFTDTNAIIDVAGLPTENINEQALYRLSADNVYSLFNGAKDNVGGGPVSWCIVDTLPEVGEAVTDANNSFGKLYYQKQDGIVYGYLTAELSGSSAMWLPADSLISALLGSDMFGGYIAEDSQATDSTKIYVVHNISYSFYHYKDGWHKVGGGKEPLIISVSGTPTASQIIEAVNAYRDGRNVVCAVYRHGVMLYTSVFSAASVNGMYLLLVETRSVDGTDTVFVTDGTNVNSESVSSGGGNYSLGSDGCNYIYLYSDGEIVSSVYIPIPSMDIDSSMSATSTNPVQNKVVTAALNSKADASAIPTKTSQLTNDSGYLTEHQSLDGLATETWVNNNAKPTVTQTLTSGTEIGLVTVGTTTTKLYAPTIEEDSVLTNEMVNAMF